MKIFLASSDDSDVPPSYAVVDSFIERFNFSQDDFVQNNPDVIWILSGGSEHKVLSKIESKNRYCLLASRNNNSWAAAVEVKAVLNEKGINTRIFDVDKLESLDELKTFITPPQPDNVVRLGLVGGVSDWLVASSPDEELLEDVLGIKLEIFRGTNCWNCPKATIFAITKKLTRSLIIKVSGRNCRL